MADCLQGDVVEIMSRGSFSTTGCRLIEAIRMKVMTTLA